MGGDGLGAGAGVALEGADGGVPGPGERCKRPFSRSRAERVAADCSPGALTAAAPSGQHPRPGGYMAAKEKREQAR